MVVDIPAFDLADRDKPIRSCREVINIIPKGTMKSDI